MQIKLNDLDTRLARIERVMSNQSLLDLSNQGESFRSDLRAMHNDIDQLSNTLEASRKQQRDLYADLDQRLKTLEGRASAGASPAAPAPSGGESMAGANTAAAAGGAAARDPAAQGSDDKSAYQAAFGLLKQGQYDRAIPAFQKFLSVYGDSSLADNAQYWLGEAYYVNRTFPEALNAFQHMVDRYPQSRKIPDALLKIGYCRYELKQWDSAREVLSKVTTQYADTPSGRLAQQRLDKMTSENH